MAMITSIHHLLDDNDYPINFLLMTSITSIMTCLMAVTTPIRLMLDDNDYPSNLVLDGSDNTNTSYA